MTPGFSSHKLTAHFIFEKMEMSEKKDPRRQTLLTTLFVHAVQFTALAAVAPVKADRSWWIRLFAAR